MSFEVEFSADVIRPGKYPAEFIGAHEREMEFGPTVRLEWRLDGDYEGERVSCLCSVSKHPLSKLGKFAAALHGSKLGKGDRCSFDEMVGTRGTVVIKEKGEYPNVVGFKRDKVQPEPEPDPYAPKDDFVF